MKSTLYDCIHWVLIILFVCSSTYLFRVFWRKKVVPTEENGHVRKDTCTTSGMQLTCCHIYCSSWRSLYVISIHLKLLPPPDACTPCPCWLCIWDSWKYFLFTEQWDPPLSWSKKWYAFWLFFFHLSSIIIILTLCKPLQMWCGF